MLSPAEKELLATLKSSLIERFGARLRQLVLFGSRARSSGRDDSDLDVIVGVHDLSPSERREVIDVAADLSVEAGLVLSPLVLDVDASGRAGEAARAFHERALQEGIPL